MRTISDRTWEVISQYFRASSGSKSTCGFVYSVHTYVPISVLPQLYKRTKSFSHRINSASDLTIWSCKTWNGICVGPIEVYPEGGCVSPRISRRRTWPELVRSTEYGVLVTHATNCHGTCTMTVHMSGRPEEHNCPGYRYENQVTSPNGRDFVTFEH